MTKLSPIESEFATTEEAKAHDAWVRAKVEKSLTSMKPRMPHDQVSVPNDRQISLFPTISVSDPGTRRR